MNSDEPYDESMPEMEIPPCQIEAADAAQGFDPDDRNAALDGDDPPPQLIELLKYLEVGYAFFQPHERRYFDRLRDLLAFHGVVSPDAVLGPTTFIEPVKRFQQARGLAADGVPGENTLWELQFEWAKQRGLSLVSTGAEIFPGTQGFQSFRLRSDVASMYNAFHNEIRSLGGVVTSAGSLRDLNATVSAGRSATSLHYTGVALDMSIHTGLSQLNNVPYLLERPGGRWQLWGRAAGGTSRQVNAVRWQNGAVTTQVRTETVIDVTAIARKHGFQPIPSRSCYPQQYICAEWWHFQCEAALVPYISQFGAELLSRPDVTVQQLKNAAQGRIFENRKLIYKRVRGGGWW